MPSWWVFPTTGSANGWRSWCPHDDRGTRRFSRICRRTVAVAIAGYKIPRQLLVVDAIPMTAAGKPDAKAAKALF